MGHFKEVEFWVSKNVCSYRVEKGPTNVFSYIRWWYKYWSLLVPLHAHPRRQQKSPARGKQIQKKTNVGYFPTFFINN